MKPKNLRSFNKKAKNNIKKTSYKQKDSIINKISNNT